MPQDTPIVVTDLDVRDPSLLVRFLRRLVDKISALADRITKVEKAPAAATPAQLRDSLQATGSTPLNVNGLLGILAQPQPASASTFSTTPTGQVLQGLQNQQLVLVGTTSTGYSLNTVLGGNPNSLYTLINGLSSGNFMTLDTVQTSTGDKTNQGLWTFNQTVTINSTASAPIVLLQTNGGSQSLIGAASSAGSLLIGSSSGDLVLRAVNKRILLTADNGGTIGMALSTTNKLSMYGGDSLSSNANGIASILSRSTQPAASAALGNTLLASAPATGEYRATWVMQATASGTTQWALSFGYTDDIGAVTFQQAPTLDTSIKNRQGGVAVIRSCSTNITYSVNQVNTSTVAPLGSYNVYVLLERLS